MHKTLNKYILSFSYLIYILKDFFYFLGNLLSFGIIIFLRILLNKRKNILTIYSIKRIIFISYLLLIFFMLYSILYDFSRIIMIYYSNNIIEGPNNLFIEIELIVLKTSIFAISIIQYRYFQIFKVKLINFQRSKVIY